MAFTAFEESDGFAEGIGGRLAFDGCFEVDDGDVSHGGSAIDRFKFGVLLGELVEGVFDVRIGHVVGGDGDFNAHVFRKFEVGNDGQRGGVGEFAVVGGGRFGFAEVENLQVGVLREGFVAYLFRQAVDEFFLNGGFIAFEDHALGSFAGAEAGDLGV